LPSGPPAQHPYPESEDVDVTEPVPFVVDSADDLRLEEMFSDDREQVVIAIRITPVYGQVDLTLLMRVVDEANRNDFALAREQLFRDEWLLCVFEAYEED
jgi:hypothetical protein